jgi:hypothetical protein
MGNMLDGMGLETKLKDGINTRIDELKAIASSMLYMNFYNFLKRPIFAIYIYFQATSVLTIICLKYSHKKVSELPMLGCHTRYASINAAPKEPVGIFPSNSLINHSKLAHNQTA